MTDVSNIQTICQKVFDNTSHWTNMFFPVLFLMRIVYANVTGSSSHEYTDAIKGAVTYWILILAFGYILNVLLIIPEVFLPDFNTATALKHAPQQQEDGSYPILEGIPFGIRLILEAISAFFYHLAVAIHQLMMIMMSGIAPIVILFATMLGLGIGVKIFFGLMVLASCWPVLWYGLNEFNSWAQEVGGNTFGTLIVDLFVQILKTAAPLWVSAAALKSGPGKAITGAVSSSLKGAEGLYSAFKQGSAAANQPISKSGSNGLPNMPQNTPGAPSNRDISNNSNSVNPAARLSQGPASSNTNSATTGERNISQTSGQPSPRFGISPNTQPTNKPAAAFPLNQQQKNDPAHAATNNQNRDLSGQDQSKNPTSASTGAGTNASSTTNNQSATNATSSTSASISSSPTNATVSSSTTGQTLSSSTTTAAQASGSSQASATTREASSTSNQTPMHTATTAAATSPTASAPGVAAPTASISNNAPSSSPTRSQSEDSSDFNSLAMQHMMTEQQKKKKRG
jgi:hypothetical protein